MKRIVFYLALLFTSVLPAQYKINGVVVSEKGEPLVGVNINIRGTQKGGITDFEGAFHIETDSLPALLVFRYIGYKTVEKVVYAPVPRLKIVMEETAENLEKLVISASRASERLLETPVAVEKLSAKQISLSVTANFYEELGKLRGVQVNANSLTFQSVNTRGFARFSNKRMVQLIDGIDNASPALNFAVGNMLGINELDVESVELLPGAASALYGANAFNGLLYIRSKSPFKYPGLNTSIKFGLTSQEWGGTHPLQEVNLRYAKAGNKFGFKINFSYLKGTDWSAKDYRDFDIHPLNADKRGTRTSNPSYDGLNIYGDEVAATIDFTPFGPPYNTLGVIRVSRTGYEEADLTDYKAKSFKTDFALHFKPRGKRSHTELIWMSRLASGQTVYQEGNRHNLVDFVLQHHKLELKNDRYFIRAYYTTENAGNSYDLRFAAININRKWKSDRDWFTQYAQAYASAVLVNGMTTDEAHTVARKFADTGRLEPGSEVYRKAFNEVTGDPDFQTGAKFVDKTSLFHLQANYDFKNLIKNGLIQIGGAFRQFNLNSQGTIFTDYDGPIHIKENSAYIQYIQKLADGHVKFSSSFRYDRQDQLKANYSPRIALVVMPGYEKKHSFRIAYQTAFRNPTTQDWYIGLNVGNISLVGAHPDNPGKYSEELIVGSNTVTITGNDAYTNAYTAESYFAFIESGDPALLEKAEIAPLGPEKVKSVEVGYRGSFGSNWNFDIAGYRNAYADFITQQVVIAVPGSVGNVNDASGVAALASGASKPFGVYTNADVPIVTYGMDMSVNKKIGKSDLNLIYGYAEMKLDRARYPDYKPYFNTPKNTWKLIWSRHHMFGSENAGFSLTYTFLDRFLWEAPFATEEIPSRHIFDAMIYFKIPKYRIRMKIGGSNITGKDYIVAPGSGKIGSIYYVSLQYNP